MGRSASVIMTLVFLGIAVIAVLLFTDIHTENFQPLFYNGTKQMLSGIPFYLSGSSCIAVQAILYAQTIGKRTLSFFLMEQHYLCGRNADSLSYNRCAGELYKLAAFPTLLYSDYSKPWHLSANGLCFHLYLVDWVIFKNRAGLTHYFPLCRQYFSQIGSGGFCSAYRTDHLYWYHRDCGQSYTAEFLLRPLSYCTLYCWCRCAFPIDRRHWKSNQR